MKPPKPPIPTFKPKTIDVINHFFRAINIVVSVIIL